MLDSSTIKLVSVCMATYNGEAYIYDQLRSILKSDKITEIIISDDGSTDKTKLIIESFNDKRIKIIEGPKKGLIQNFENAIKNSSGEVIFLSDQDDIWLDLKVDSTLEKLHDYDLVCSDCFVTNEKLEITNQSFFELNKSRKGIIKNIIKNSYLGCCLAFKRELIKDILPFPKKIGMHDWWIGLVAELKYSTFFLDEKLIYFRRHSNTNSITARKSNFSIAKKIKWRLYITFNLFKLDKQRNNEI